MQALLFSQFLVFALVGYLFGNILFGLILSKIKKQDLRSTGSGNVGATNVLRTFGKAAGLLVFFVDMIKTWLAVMICVLIYQAWAPQFLTSRELFQRYGFIVYSAGLFSVIGHSFPIFYVFKLFATKFNFEECKNFSGGKGAAATAGFFLAVTPWIFITAFLAFWVIFFAFRYVSVASMGSIIFGTLLLLIPEMDYLYMANFNGSEILDIPSISSNINELGFINYVEHWRYIVSIFAIAVLISIIIVYKHRPNIIKLMNGTEKKMFSKKE